MDREFYKKGVEDLLSTLRVAGFEIKKYWELKDNYDQERCYPWLLIDTKFGKIIIGYRHRVISIEWDDTKFACEVTEDKVTKDSYSVHAYSLLDAAKYLGVLKTALLENEAKKAPPTTIVTQTLRNCNSCKELSAEVITVTIIKIDEKLNYLIDYKCKNCGCMWEGTLPV